MKKLIAATLALLMMTSLLAGCGQNKGDQALTAEERTQLYKDAILNCGAEMVEYNKPVTSGEDETAEMVLSLLGVAEEDMESFAISLSGMNIKAYAIALIMPAADKAEAVLESVNAYVATQQQSFETYLADQYEIAKNAKVETLEDGTILLVMTEDGDKVYDAIVGALEAK